MEFSKLIIAINTLVTLYVNNNPHVIVSNSEIIK